MAVFILETYYPSGTNLHGQTMFSSSGERSRLRPGRPCPEISFFNLFFSYFYHFSVSKVSTAHTVTLIHIMIAWLISTHFSEE